MKLKIVVNQLTVSKVIYKDKVSFDGVKLKKAVSFSFLFNSMQGVVEFLLNNEVPHSYWAGIAQDQTRILSNVLDPFVLARDRLLQSGKDAEVYFIYQLYEEGVLMEDANWRVWRIIRPFCRTGQASPYRKGYQYPSRTKSWAHNFRITQVTDREEDVKPVRAKAKMVYDLWNIYEHPAAKSGWKMQSKARKQWARHLK